jgi:hypothetical protein
MQLQEWRVAAAKIKSHLVLLFLAVGFTAGAALQTYLALTTDLPEPVVRAGPLWIICVLTWVCWYFLSQPESEHKSPLKPKKSLSAADKPFRQRARPRRKVARKRSR